MGKWIPHLYARNINQINWKALADNLGIKYLVFDKDDTLTLHDSANIHESLTDHTFQAIFRKFHPKHVFICSNNSNFTFNEAGLENVKETIGISSNNGIFSNCTH